VRALERRELVAEDRARLAGLERLDGRRASAVGGEERELAEALAGTEHVHEHAVADGREHARSEAATHDQVQRLGRVVAMEYDFTLGEGPPTGNREQLMHVPGGKTGEQRPLHG
jgi:hypothetical protein